MTIQLKTASNISQNNEMIKILKVLKVDLFF